MNYQIYLGTAGLNSQCLPHILYHWAGGTVKHHQADSQTEIFKIPRKKKTYFMVVLIFDILSREAAAGY